MKKHNLLVKKFGQRYAVKAMVALALIIATSCEVTPSLDENLESKRSAELKDSMGNSGRILAANQEHLPMISLHLASNTLAGGIIQVEVRDETGTQIIGSSSRSFAVGESPNGWVNFSFPPTVVLTKGVKYRIYVTRLANTTGVITWTGLSGTEDWYVQGQSSAGGNGDFNFVTFSMTGARDQACFAGIGTGVNLVVGESHWQEFIPGDTNIALRTVNLLLRVNLYSPENLFVDIRTSNGTVIATIQPVSSGQYGEYWVNFTFQNPVVLDRTQLYQIYARRTNFPSYFEPWNGVFLHYTSYDSYPYANPGYDHVFRTDANGFPDQQQLSYNSTYYPTPLHITQTGSARQEFRPGAPY